MQHHTADCLKLRYEKFSLIRFCYNLIRLTLRLVLCHVISSAVFKITLWSMRCYGASDIHPYALNWMEVTIPQMKMIIGYSTFSAALIWSDMAIIIDLSDSVQITFRQSTNIIDSREPGFLNFDVTGDFKQYIKYVSNDNINAHTGICPSRSRIYYQGIKRSTLQRKSWDFTIYLP